MYRLWGGKIMKNNKFRADHVFELDNKSLSREDKLKQGLEALAYHFDIQMPIWLPDNEKDFAAYGKARFYDDHFIETLDFDYFEIEVIEDDKAKGK